MFFQRPCVISVAVSLVMAEITLPAKSVSVSAQPIRQ